jgi:hypothetical protein
MSHYRSNRGGRNGHRAIKDYSNEWLQTLQTVTSCLRNPNATMEDLDVSMKFLNQLEALLLVKERKWHRPPNELPPQFESLSNHQNGGNQDFNSYHGNGRTNVAVVSPVISPPSSRFANNSNRYASIQDDDDDSDEDESVDDELEDEAGDHVTYHSNGGAKALYIEGMDMRRIMIRILNLQSDIYAAQAHIYRKQQPPNWTFGAQQYTYCLHKVHSALILADSEISKWMSSLSHDSMMYHKVVLLLTEDANIVEVSVHSITTNRDDFLNHAHRVEAKLVQKLQPQWQARDEVKERMGKERWYSNPNPKREYARQREEYEKQLKDIRIAVLCLEALDTTIIVESTKQLRDRLRGGGGGYPPNGDVAVPMPPQNQQDVAGDAVVNSGERYNGMRPRDVSRRVDIQYYPDPTHFGWTFTGSSGVTEFFEKDGVKLDWYFTTATIKTSLDHPRQGRTQSFGSRVDPETYRAILENPRAHTGQRYQQRQGGKPRRN